MKTIKMFNKQPEHSIIGKGIVGDIHYIDCFCMEIENTNHYSVDYLTALIFTSVPGWVRSLLKIRDVIVKPFGLKTGILLEKEALGGAQK